MKDEAPEPLDLSELPVAEPPPGFADRVMARVREEGANDLAAARLRRTRWAAAGVGTLAAAAAVVLAMRGRAPDAGEATAEARVEVAVGARAKAVLEPGAHVTWRGPDVVQSNGDVFYRVEPGATFTVHTPAGDVSVQGTCFTVKVRSDEDTMQKRDVKAGTIGAALSALAFVAVHEGRVAVSHAQERVELAAGESARLGAGHASRSGTVAEGERAFAEAAAAADAPLAKANENLTSQVSEYRKRLEHVATERASLEEKLRKAEAALAGTQDGGAPRTRHEYDLDKEDWAELAAKGTVKFRTPCLRPGGWAPKPEEMDKLGLAPQDSATLKEAYARAYQRAWAQIRPLCQAALGSSTDAVDKIGVDSCAHLVYDVAQSADQEATAEAHTQAAEIRAGQRPEPGPNDKVHPVTRLFLALTAQLPAFEADLAKSFGPEEAHRLVFADGMCRSDDRWGGGKKRGAAK